MHKNSRLILAGAVLAAIPAVSKAAFTLTVTLDTTVLKYGPSGTASSGWASLPVAGAAPSNGIYFNSTTDTAFIPAGDGVVVGYDAAVGGTSAPVGIAQFGFGLSNSTAATAFPAGFAGAAGTVLFGGTNLPTYNPSFTGGNFTNFATKSNVTGGITPPGSLIGTGWASGSNTPVGWLPAGVGAGSLIISNLEFDAPSSDTSASTPATFALTNPTTGNLYRDYAVFTSLPTPGTPGTTTGASTLLTSGTDTVSLTGATFSVAIAGASGTTTTTSSTTSASHQPIVSLTNTTPSTYGTQIGNPIVISGHNGSYTVGFTGTTLNQSGGTGYTTGYTAVSVFNPLTDTEVYALKLNASGAALSPTSTEVALIVADLNAGTGAGTAGVNVSAGAVAGSPYASLFPGYDILLVSTGAFGGANVNGGADLGIDFSQDTDAATPGLVVTEVAAVPEPATLAGIVLGASGLLLGRRKKQIATA